MVGLCLVAGAVDAEQRIAAMLAQLAPHGAATAGRALGPDLALGRASYPWQKPDPAIERDADGIAVAVLGEIFDADGPVTEPNALVREVYGREELDRLAYLDGSFAAVIVDRPRRRVILATDRLGARPLFVWQRDGQLAVASRLDALLTDDRVPRRLSFQGLSELLCYQRTVFDQTQYADILAMPAAEVWTFAEGRLERRQTRRLAWRRPDFDEREGGVRLAEVLRRAAARRTAGPARVGLLLSGGLDSRMVLAAARAAGRAVPCITSGTHDNLEVSLARASAARAGVPFRFVANPPDRLAATLDAATTASDGLFAAPLNLFGLWPEIVQDYDVLLSGHALDYTLRGYYLPCVMIRVGNSTTRLPKLRRIRDGTPATVAASLRVGLAPEAVCAVLRPGLAAEWKQRTIAAMARALAQADIEDPYNAWDSFVLHTLGRHYAYSDFVAMENYAPHRTLAYDPEVFELYLSMPPAWRASGRMAHAAMRRLGEDLMGLPDANTGFAAKQSFWTHISLIYLRAAARSLGLSARPTVPDPTMTQGSWPDYAVLYRRDPIFLGRLKGLSTLPALMDTGLFSRDGIERMVEDHLAGKANHKKLLDQLLTIASWLSAHPYSGVVFDR